MELENMPAAGATNAPTIATPENSSDNYVPQSNPQDLYSLVPYPDNYYTRAETRQCFTTEEPNVQVTWTDTNSENDGNCPLLPIGCQVLMFG